MENSINRHPEWNFCGRCKYFSPFDSTKDFEKDNETEYYGTCEHPKGNERIVAAIADCSMFKKESLTD